MKNISTLCEANMYVTKLELFSFNSFEHETILWTNRGRCGGGGK
jgi:hypothetical protein